MARLKLLRKKLIRLIELLFYVFAGCILGIFTGLAPGIHINTVSIVLIELSSDKNPNLVFLIIAMSIVHSFVDFIPSILLGAPDSTNYLSVLPGHRLLLKGKGHYAVKLAVFGGMIGCIVSLLLIPVYFLFIEDSIAFISAQMQWILTFFLLLMIFSEKGIKEKFFTIIIVLFSGVVGLIALNGHLKLNEPLFPVITGFFGISTLVESIGTRQKIEIQRTRNIKFNKAKLLKNSFLGVIAGCIVSLIPSVGPNQSAFIIGKIVGKLKTSSYMIVLGAVNSSNMLFSFFALYALGKGRSGSAAAIKQIMQLQEKHLLYIAATVLISMAFAVFASNFLAKKLINKIQQIEYGKLGFGIIFLLVFLVFMFSGAIGLLFLFTTASIGLLAIKFRVKRTNCMAFLIIPTIIIYLKMNGIG